MANNVFIGPNSLVARVADTFANMGFTADNVSIIYEIGNSLKSWVPGRSINGVTGTVVDKGYYIVSLVNADLTALFKPDFEVNVPRSRILSINGVALDLSANRSWTIDAGEGTAQFTTEEADTLRQIIQSFTT